MEITKKLLQDIRPEMDAVLQPIAEKYGITITVGNGKYGGMTGQLKVNLSTTNEDGDDKRAVAYKRYASQYGLKEEWLGLSFKHRSGIYTIVGLDPSRSKNALVLRRERDGSIRIAPPSMAIHLMPVPDGMSYEEIGLGKTK